MFTMRLLSNFWRRAYVDYDLDDLYDYFDWDSTEGNKEEYCNVFKPGTFSSYKWPTEWPRGDIAI